MKACSFVTGGHVAFEIGDKVIYPNHGLGIVERVETKTIMGTTCGFYQLRMANETTVFVPVDNVDGVGLRRAITDEEVQRLYDLLGDGNIDTHQNWKGRFKDNSDRMRTGSIYDVVEVLKSLAHLAKSKSLSFREKRMLDRAKFLVISEISEVRGEKVVDVEVRVDASLERCFVEQAKNPSKPKVTKPAPPVYAPSAPTPVVMAPRPVPAVVRPATTPAAPARPAVTRTASPAMTAVVEKAAKSVAKSVAKAEKVAAAKAAQKPTKPAKAAKPAKPVKVEKPVKAAKPAAKTAKVAKSAKTAKPKTAAAVRTTRTTARPTARRQARPARAAS